MHRWNDMSCLLQCDGMLPCITQMLMQLGMWNYSKRESEPGHQKWHQFPQGGVSLPFAWDLIHCGTQPEQRCHISSLKGNYALTRHKVLRSKMPKEENFSYWGPNGHLFSQQIFIEDLNNCLHYNKWVNEWKSKVCLHSPVQLLPCYQICCSKTHWGHPLHGISTCDDTPSSTEENPKVSIQWNIQTLLPSTFSSCCCPCYFPGTALPPLMFSFIALC